MDVPAYNGEAAFTRFFSPGAIYSINPITEEIARGLLDHYRNQPVSRFELPQLADKVQDNPLDGAPPHENDEPEDDGGMEGDDETLF